MSKLFSTRVGVVKQIDSCLNSCFSPMEQSVFSCFWYTGVSCRNRCQNGDSLCTSFYHIFTHFYCVGIVRATEPANQLQLHFSWDRISALFISSLCWVEIPRRWPSANFIDQEQPMRSRIAVNASYSFTRTAKRNCIIGETYVTQEAPLCYWWPH